MSASSSRRAFSLVLEEFHTLKDTESAMMFYKDWHTHYDQDQSVHHNGPMIVGRCVHKHLTSLGFSTDAPILDVGAGTGLVAQHLAQYGYTTLDAVDGSPEMLDVARPKNLYRDLVCCFVGDGNKLPMDDSVYTAAVLCGCFSAGHIKCDALDEMIRVVKPGGVIVTIMYKDNVENIPEYRKLLPMCAAYEEQGKWRRLEHTVPEEKYSTNRDGLLLAYQVL